MQSKNLAARAGRWSAAAPQDRDLRLARVRRRSRSSSAARSAPRRSPTRTTATAPPRSPTRRSRAADFPRQGRRAGARPGRKGSVKASDAAFKAAVKDVVARLETRQARRRGRVPARQGQRGPALQGRPLRARARSRSPATTTSPRIASTPRSPPPPPRRRRIPSCAIEQFGDASADKALDGVLDDDFKQAEFLSLPITLLILVVAFGALVAAGVPLLLGLTAVIGDARPRRADQPARSRWTSRSSSVILLIGLAVGVDYSMFYLRRKMEERDAGRSPRGRARVRRRHLRPGRARSPA